MIKIKGNSDLKKAFQFFRRINKLNYILTPWSLCLLYSYSAAFLLLLTFVSCALNKLPSASNPVPFLSLQQFNDQKWLYSLTIATACLLPFFLIGIYIVSMWIKKDLRKKRGIVISSLHWRGPEIDDFLIARFKNYLVRHRLHNVDSLEQLMENVRDEIASEKRPSERILTLLTIALALAIALWEPVYSQLLSLWVHSPVEIWQVTGLTIVVCMYLVFFLTVFPWAYVPSRTRLEKYLHSLTTIRLELMKSTPRCPRLRAARFYRNRRERYSFQLNPLAQEE
jgi:hypothetical protein